MRYEFGGIVVDSEQIKIIKHGEVIECEPRVFELLVYFCCHPQEAISRERLVAQVWSGRVVSDAAINRAVGELRKIIEVTPSSPQWLKTVSKVGYRFTVIPTKLENQDTSNSVHQNTTDYETTQSILTTKRPLKINSGVTLNLKSKLLWSLVVLIILVLLVINNISPQKKVEAFEVLGRQPVTATMGSAFNPYYHEKTNTLVYLYRSDTDSYAQLYMEKDNKSPQFLTKDEYYYTDVLYGGDGFIYASRLNNLEQRFCEIIKINPLTKLASIVIDCGKRVVTQLGFDEKKNRLIYQYRPSISEPYALYSYQLDTGRKQQITHPKQSGYNLGDYAFALSADNETLAIIEYFDDESDKLKLMDLNDNRIISVTPFINNVYGLLWRSEHGILASNADGLFEFNTRNHSFLVRENSDQFGRLARGKNNLSILTERSQTTVNIFKYSKINTKIQSLTASSGSNVTPILGNSSNILAFKSNRKGKTEIYIQPEGKAAYIAEFDKKIEYIGSMAWSPKDDKLIASIEGALYLYSLERKTWQKLAQDFTKVHHITFVQNSIMFSAERDGLWNIWALSLHNNQVSQITSKGGYSVQANSNKVYFTKFNHDGLYELNLASGLETIVIEDFPIAGWRHWQLLDDKIYYLLNKNYNELYLKTSENHVLYEFEGSMPNSCFTSYQHDFFACEKVEVNTSNIWQFQLSQ